MQHSEQGFLRYFRNSGKLSCITDPMVQHSILAQFTWLGRQIEARRQLYLETSTPGTPVQCMTGPQSYHHRIWRIFYYQDIYSPTVCHVMRSISSYSTSNGLSERPQDDKNRWRNDWDMPCSILPPIEEERVQQCVSPQWPLQLWARYFGSIIIQCRKCVWPLESPCTSSCSSPLLWCR